MGDIKATIAVAGLPQDEMKSAGSGEALPTASQNHHGFVASGIQTLATYLVEGQAVPYTRASQLLQELLGVRLSADSIVSFVKICHQQLAGVEQELKATLVQAHVLNQDETGLRVDKESWWVHVCSTNRLIHYAAHPSRGRAGLDTIGITPAFHGISVYDGFVSYQGYSFIEALCNVHHLHELTFIEEMLKQIWGTLFPS